MPQIFKDWKTFGNRRYLLVATFDKKVAAERMAKEESKPAPHYESFLKMDHKVVDLGKNGFGVYRWVEEPKIK